MSTPTPKPDGGPAFPQPFIYEGDKGKYGAYTLAEEVGAGGMTLRAWLVGQALVSCGNHIIMTDEAIADRCVGLADAVIARLNQTS